MGQLLSDTEGLIYKLNKHALLCKEVRGQNIYITVEGQVHMEGARQRSQDLYFSRDCQYFDWEPHYKGEHVSLACK